MVGVEYTSSVEPNINICHDIFPALKDSTFNNIKYISKHYEYIINIQMDK